MGSFAIPSGLAPLPGGAAPQQADPAAGADAFMAPSGPTPQQQADVQAAVQNVNQQSRQAQLALDSQLQQIQGIVGTFPMNGSEVPGKLADAISQVKQLWAELLLQVTTQAPEPQGAPPVISMR
jgi:hypothetical protein